MKDRLLVVQRMLIGTGVALLLVWGAAQLHRHIGQQQDMAAFEAAREAMARERILLAQTDATDVVAQVAAAQPQAAQDPVVSAPKDEIPSLPVAGHKVDEPAADSDLPPPPMPADADPDYSLWSPKRVEDYKSSLAARFDTPQALLRIPAIDLEVLVLDGIDELTLNRGVGRIPGTERPGGLGNIGIAGHRDGFFRGLKDIGSGDTIELVTWRQKMTYKVASVTIVEQDDLHVLEPTDKATVTLVTCYPFYFIGHAPKRYIVKATLEDAVII
jgi:LPXTG-site transpeptidase (sortase) family protein